ncbi:HAMP domain-containing sensor histidine kinase [Roseburia hominis]
MSDFSGKEWFCFGLMLVGACMVFCVAVWFCMRRKYVRFTEKMEEVIEQIMRRNAENFRCQPYLSEHPEGRHLGGQNSVEGRTEKHPSLDLHSSGVHDMVNEDTLPSRLIWQIVQLDKWCQYARESALSQKQEIQQMVSDISHQLKTPIANIMMYQDMLAMHSLSKEKEDACICILQQEVRKLDFLVQALMKMSRLESAMIVLEQKRADLCQCVAQALAGITRRAGEKLLAVRTECPEECMACIDRKWTVEAIENVLDNAVKYSGDGKSIEISITELEMYARLDIRDEGPGIAEEQFEKIFRRFYRAPEVHDAEGVGIGLYLTREILSRQGGYIKVESKVGEGSCFSLYFLKE